ncbi:hypothetical protein [Streptomyces sp. NPDC049040]|uniref:hypothetical protein n=1 Tax=Streptomyces sp. NPDC049040 TaxID=3365593 RepID=UPI00371D06E8
MISRTLTRAAAAVSTSVLVVMVGGGATAVAQNGVQPQAVPGSVIKAGADGSPRTLMCPPEESVLSGGFVLSAPQGRHLGRAAADLVESRPTEDATGWIIAVRKNLAPAAHGRSAAHGTPADLTLYVVCTQGENTPGG